MYRTLYSIIKLKNIVSLLSLTQIIWVNFFSKSIMKLKLHNIRISNNRFFHQKSLVIHISWTPSGRQNEPRNKKKERRVSTDDNKCVFHFQRNLIALKQRHFSVFLRSFLHFKERKKNL